MFKNSATTAVLICCVFGSIGGTIIGGEPVDIKEFPYQISLHYYGGHLCAGAIIAGNYVLVAAHCTNGFTASYLSIRAGSSFRENGGQVINITSIIRHPKWNAEIQTDYDIAVLRLEHCLQMECGVQAIAVASKNHELPPGTDCIVSGWESGSNPTQLQAVHIPIISQQDCRNAYAGFQIPDRMLCAGFKQGNNDYCFGNFGVSQLSSKF